MVKKTDYILNELNKISFIGLRKFKCGSALSAFLHINKSIDFNELKRQYHKLKLIPNYNSEKQENGSILFFFGVDYSWRRDYLLWFNNITSLSRNKIVVSPSNYADKKNRTKYKWVYIVIWLIQMYKIPLPLLYKIACCIELLYALENVENIIAKLYSDIKKVNLVITLCDIFSTDSLFIQYIKSRGVETATFQHGQMGEKWYFRYSESDKFLCFGKQAKLFAIKACKINKEKMIPLGMPMCIKSKKTFDLRCKETNKFAVILENGFDAGVHNILLIKICNKLAHKYNLKYILRPHPSDNIGGYSKYIDKDVFLEYSYKNQSIEALANEVQFSITGNTSVFGQLVYMMFPIFIYIGRADMYKGIKWGKFKNLYGLELLYLELKKEKESTKENICKTRKFLCEENIEENYRNFFSLFEGQSL